MGVCVCVCVLGVCVCVYIKYYFKKSILYISELAQETSSLITVM